MKDGWVKLKRAMIYDEIMEKDGDYLKVYIYLLLSAWTSERVILKGREKITLNSGEVLVSIRGLSKALFIEPTKVSRIISFLEKHNKIQSTVKYGQTLVVISDLGSLEVDSATKNATVLQHFCNDFEEKQDEKEKRSKREKEEIKELNNKREIECLFEEFWRAYPKKVGKGYAKACFFKLKADRGLLDAMLTALKWQKESDSWHQKDGKYIPNPSTWLNGARWEDENYTVKNENKDGWGTYI